MQLFALFDLSREIARDTNLTGAFANDSLLRLYPVAARELRRRIAAHGVDPFMSRRSFLVPANSSVLSYGFRKSGVSSVTLVESRRVSSSATINGIVVDSNGKPSFSCSQPHGMVAETPTEVVVAGVRGMDVDGTYLANPTGDYGFEVPGLLVDAYADEYVVDSGLAIVPLTPGYTQMMPIGEDAWISASSSGGAGGRTYRIDSGRLIFSPSSEAREFRIFASWPVEDGVGLNSTVDSSLSDMLAHMTLAYACQEIDQEAHNRNMSIALGPGWLNNAAGGMLHTYIASRLKSMNAEQAGRNSIDDYSEAGWPRNEFEMRTV